MPRVAIVLCALAACGRLHFDDSSDAGTDGGQSAPWLAVATGTNTSCAIASDHSLSCWGLNQIGQTGTGNAAEIVAPSPVGTAAWSSVAIASDLTDGDHACGIQIDRSLWCWGAGSTGELGIGSTENQPTPALVDAGPWSAVAVGDGFSCGIRDTGALLCWGDNSAGELGMGSVGDRKTPTAVGGATWQALTAQGEAVCGIRTDGTLWCWGDSSSFQLGLGAPGGNVATPTLTSGASWRSVQLAADDACGLQSDGSVWCWGGNNEGQLIVGDANPRETPTKIGVPVMSAIAIGAQHVCGLSAGGAVSCWGDGSRGQFGADPGANGNASAPFAVVAGNVASLSLGGDDTCVIDGNGQLACTGNNAFGQLGTPAGENHDPAVDDGRTDWATVFAAYADTCAIDLAGDLSCTGAGGIGELGDGSGRDEQSLSKIGTAYAGVAIGSGAMAGVAIDGTLREWGVDPVTFDQSDSPVVVGSGVGSAAIGDDYACALAGAALTCRGANARGQLGNNTTTASTGAIVPGSFNAVMAHGHTTCAINGTTIRCWGQNDRGQVGDGTMTDQLASAMVLANVVDGTRGPDFTCAVKSDGTLWCWGANDVGQLAIGTQVDHDLPVQVGTATDWVQVSAGASHACAIKLDQSLWCWGDDTDGELGDFAFIEQHAPIQVAPQITWHQVACADNVTCAIATDHTRHCFGANTTGQLGNGAAWHTGFVAIP